jgi:hypothetical protein
MRSFAPPSAAPRAFAEQRSEGADNRGREFGIVDLLFDADQSAAWGLSPRLRERGVRAGIVKSLTGLFQRRHAELGQEEAHRPVHKGRPFADPAADLLVLRVDYAH